MNKVLYLLTGGVLGFLLGETISFIKNFYNDYDFDLNED